MLVSRSAAKNQWVKILEHVTLNQKNEYISSNAPILSDGAFSDIKLVWRSGGLSQICESTERDVGLVTHSTSMASKLIFDGLDNTIWRTTPKTNTDHDLIYVPSSSNDATNNVDGRNRGWVRFTVKVGTTNLNEAPTSIALAGKRDGSNEWITLHQIESITPWSSSEERSFDLGDVVSKYGAFREYKFSFRSKTDRVSIGEIRMYGLRRGASPSRGWPTCDDGRWTSFLVVGKRHN